MTPWRRAAVASVLALACVALTLLGLWPAAPPDAGGLVLLFLAAWGAGLLVAGAMGGAGLAGVGLSLLAGMAATLLGSVFFGLMLAPPRGGVMVPLATLALIGRRPWLLLVLAVGYGLAHAAARRR